MSFVLICTSEIALSCGASPHVASKWCSRVEHLQERSSRIEVEKSVHQNKNFAMCLNKKSVGCDRVLDLSFLLEPCSCVSSIAFAEGAGQALSRPHFQVQQWLSPQGHLNVYFRFFEASLVSPCKSPSSRLSMLVACCAMMEFSILTCCVHRITLGLLGLMTVDEPFDNVDRTSYSAFPGIRTRLENTSARNQISQNCCI